MRSTSCLLIGALGALVAGVAWAQADAQDHYQRAKAAYGEGKFAEARELAASAAATDPKNPEAFLLLGKAEYQLGNLDGACAAWKKTLALAPEEPYTRAMLDALSASAASVDARIAVIKILREEGITAAALSETDALLARGVLSPAQRAALTTLGAALKLDSGAFDEAVARAQTVRALHPREADRAEIACILGQAKLAKGGLAAQEGRELLAGVMAEHGGTAAAHRARGVLLMQALKENPTAERAAEVGVWLAAAPCERPTRLAASKLRAETLCTVARGAFDAHVRACGLASPAGFEAVAPALDAAFEAYAVVSKEFPTQPAWREFWVLLEYLVGVVEKTPCAPTLADVRPIDAMLAARTLQIVLAAPDAATPPNAVAAFHRVLAPYQTAGTVGALNAAAALSGKFLDGLPAASAVWLAHAARHATILAGAVVCEFRANAGRSNTKLSSAQEAYIALLGKIAALDAAAARACPEQFAQHLTPWLEARLWQTARDAWEKLGAVLPAAERRIAERKIAELLIAECRHEEAFLAAAGLDAPRALDPRIRDALARCHALQAGLPEGSPELAAVRGIVDGVIESLKKRELFDPAREALSVKSANAVPEAEEYAELLGAQLLEARARAALQAARAAGADHDAPPLEASAEFVAALEAYKAFVKAHQGSPRVAAAVGRILGVARYYAALRAWAVAEAVIADCASLGSGFDDPERLVLLRGACRLGAAMPARARALFDAELEGKPLPDETAPVSPQAVAPPPVPVAANNDMGVQGWSQTADMQVLVQGMQVQLEEQTVQEGAQPPAQNRVQPPAQQAAQQAEPQPPQQRVQAPRPAQLTEVELARIEKSFGAAYEVFQGIVKGRTSLPVAARARGEILGMARHWRVLGQWRRAAALIERFLTDNPGDTALPEFRLTIARDLLAWSSIPVGRKENAQEAIAEVNARAQAARIQLEAFVKDFPRERERAEAARWDSAMSLLSQARAVRAFSVTPARGQYVRAARELEKLASSPRAHARANEVPQILWQIAEELEGCQCDEDAIVLWHMLKMEHPTHGLADQAALKIAQVCHEKLKQPLRAAEAYQELHFMRGGDAGVLEAIFEIGNELFEQKRWAEALHILENFADSYPYHALAGRALTMAGQIHQTNEAWQDAIAAYRRVIDEYPESEWVQRARWAIAECTLNLSRWQEAAEAYRAYVAAYPKDGQVEEANRRVEVLKDLARYQGLVDEPGQRKSFDAQFQIAGIVLAKLANPVKAIIEYRKVVEKWPESHLADDALHAIGTTYIALGETAKAREALLAVGEKYPTSPLADDALLAVGKSYEDEAEKLGAVTRETSREIAQNLAQRNAYLNVQNAKQAQKVSRAGVIAQLKKGGKGASAEAEEASVAGNWGQFNDANVVLFARKAAQEIEALTASQLADRQDKIAAALRKAVEAYAGASQIAGADKADEALLQMASIYDARLKNAEAAMKTWLEIVRLFSGTAVAENASWRLCQYYERKSAWAEAIEAHKAFVRNYRRSPMAGAAQYAIAEGYEHLGEWVNAMDSYTNYLTNFPEGPLAAKAKEQINWIKTYRL